MKQLILILLTTILISCGASIKSNFQTQNKALTIEDKVAFLSQLIGLIIIIKNIKLKDNLFLFILRFFGQRFLLTL